MPSVEDELIEASTDRQDDVRERAAAASLLLIALLDETEAELRAIVERYLALLNRPRTDLGAAEVQLQIDNMRREIQVLRTAAFERIIAEVQKEMETSAREEWAFLTETYSGVADVAFDAPSDANLADIVGTQFHGRDADTWLRDLADADANRIADAVVIGLIQGRPTLEILRAAVGSEGFDGADGVTNTTRRALSAVVDAAVFAAVAQAAEDIFGLNAEQVPTDLYVAVLDDRTTPICRSLNGKRFPRGRGPIPPLHWFCRSRRVALPVG